MNSATLLNGNKWIRQFKNLKILKAKLFMSIHIFKAMLQILLKKQHHHFSETKWSSKFNFVWEQKV